MGTPWLEYMINLYKEKCPKERRASHLHPDDKELISGLVMATTPAAALGRPLRTRQIAFLQPPLEISMVGVQVVDPDITIQGRAHPILRCRHVLQLLGDFLEIKRQVLGNKGADLYVLMVADQRQSVVG